MPSERRVSSHRRRRGARRPRRPGPRGGGRCGGGRATRVVERRRRGPAAATRSRGPRRRRSATGPRRCRAQEQPAAQDVAGQQRLAACATRRRARGSRAGSRRPRRPLATNADSGSWSVYQPVNRSAKLSASAHCQRDRVAHVPGLEADPPHRVAVARLVRSDRPRAHGAHSTRDPASCSGSCSRCHRSGGVDEGIGRRSWRRLRSGIGWRPSASGEGSMSRD